MRAGPIHPLQRETTARRIEQRPTDVFPHPRSLTFQLGPSTPATREFITVAAIVTRPCVITQVGFFLNTLADPVLADVLISRDTLTDTDAQLRDHRLSRQRGRRVGFISSIRGPTHDIREYYHDAPLVLKGYLYSPSLIGAIMTISLTLEIA